MDWICAEITFLMFVTKKKKICCNLIEIFTNWKIIQWVDFYFFQFFTFLKFNFNLFQKFKEIINYFIPLSLAIGIKDLVTKFNLKYHSIDSTFFNFKFQFKCQHYFIQVFKLSLDLIFCDIIYDGSIFERLFYKLIIYYKIQ